MSPDEEAEKVIVASLQFDHHAVSAPEHIINSTTQSKSQAPSPSSSPILKPVTYSPFPQSRNGTPTPAASNFPPSRKGTPNPGGPSRHGTPTPEPAGAGAAQFIANLSEKQRAHLQFAVPTKSESDRLSHFLEEPRKTPVPDRFTFEALDSEARSNRELNSKVRRGDTKKSLYGYKVPRSVRSGKSTRSDKSSRSSSRSTSRHTQESSAAGSAGRMTPGTPSSRGVSFESIPKSRPQLKKEVRHFKGVALEVDWRFYATGVCLALVNFVLAWDSTAISIALPVCKNISSNV